MATHDPLPENSPGTHLTLHKPWRLVLVIGLVPVVLAAIFAGHGLSSPVHALEPPRKFNPTDIKLVNPYHIEPVIENLTAPTAAVFDGNDLIIAESGSNGAVSPRILRIKSDGSVSVVVSSGLRGLVMGLAVKDGFLYVSHKDKVSRVDPNGQVRDLVTGLPSDGDYQNNNLVFGTDGRLYLGQGTVTNAGVVGEDSYALGWLDLHPKLHDVPCQDVVLLGQNYRTSDPMNPGSNLPMLTGAYESFGAPSVPDEKIQGNLKCGGAILRFNPDGSNLEPVAWGLRNPVGLNFDKTGQLWVTNQGPEVRGSRNIANAPDVFIKVMRGAWYGFPDYFDGQPVTADRFIVPGKPQSGFLWDSHPPLSNAFLSFAPGENASGFAFSPGGAFGLAGDAFIAMFGPPAGSTGNVGFRIARVDPGTRQVDTFASNSVPGPAYENSAAGLDRPLQVLFGPDGSMYIVDMGVTRRTIGGLVSAPYTGAVWRIYPASGQALHPNGPIMVQPSTSAPANERPMDTGDAIGSYLVLAVMAAPAFVLLIGGLIVAGFVLLVAWRIIRAMAH